MSKAILMLEDGRFFSGQSCGVQGETFGELCFNTSMIGYPEVISDPSYAGQIVVMTYPQIGNYGVARADLQRSVLALRGLVAREIDEEPSNFRSDLSLVELLQEQQIVGICDIDTRALTRHIRDKGTLRAIISTTDLNTESLLAKVKESPLISNTNLAQTVSVKEPQFYVDDPSLLEFARLESPEPNYRVVAYDCGAKHGIMRALVQAGCEVEMVPWNTSADAVLAKEPSGVFFSNGPGSPEPLTETLNAARALLQAQIPLFGVCLGHQILATALGATTQKLPQGHHGGNLPVMDLLTGRVEITTQNHGFDIDFASLGALVPELSGGESEHKSDLRFWSNTKTAPVVNSAEFGRVQLTHVNLNDGTLEGIALLDRPAFSVQFHPEASPGPSDGSSLFAAFTRLMDGQSNYFTAAASPQRFEGWR